MRIFKYTTQIIAITLLSVNFYSCQDDDETDPDLNVPSTYSFTDSEGNSTVDFSGQTARLNQLAEIVTYMKTANTPGVELSESQLLEMYSNNNGEGSSFFSDDANAAGKQLRDKTAGGNAAYQEKFENLFSDLAEVSALTIADEYDASNGTAGVIQSGEKAYLVNAKGGEYAQLIEKGLMGAVFYDQIQNGYLGDEKMNVDNSEPVDPANGKYYTTMEHHWDEAYGYFTSATDFPTNGTDRFWGKYSHTVDEALGTDEKIMDAYLTGRAAIAINDLNIRDEQIVIIRTELEKVAAAVGIHYLNGAISNFADDAVRSHELSEAAAFIEALYFTSSETAVISGAEVEEILEFLKDGDGDYNFYEVTVGDLTSARDMLAGYIGMDDIKSEL